ncbi:MAG: TonB-dependent receptor [Candidatus Acidiferrales bacterium]
MAKRNAIGLLAGAVLALLVISTPAFPQGAETGGMTGVVKDSKGAAVPDATVEIYNEQTSALVRSPKTDSDGNYAVALLPPGSYRVEVTVSGFKKYRGVGVPVRINEVTRHDVALELGSVSETVVVEATATLINTANATTGQPVDHHTLTSLPLASPNYLFLLTLSPGANSEPIDVRSAGRGNVDIVVNGQRTSNNSVALEGVNVNDFNLAHFDNLPIPNPSAIEEFRVATSLYDASQGSKGGGAVALVLKSGTKAIHGEAYWQHRNDALNANEWFRNSTSSPRGRLLQNVFGGSGSGPFWGIGGFWFVNYTGARARNGIDPNGSTLSPTIQNFPRNADGTASAAALAARYGLTGSQIDPIALNIINLKKSPYGGTYLIPRLGDPGCDKTINSTTVTASSPDGTFSCTFSAVAPISDNQFVTSYDRAFRQDRDKFSARFFYDNGQVQKPFGTAGDLAFPQGNVLHNRFASITYTHLFSSRQTNEFRVGFSRFLQQIPPTDLVTLADIGATRPNISTVPGMYFINISGLFALGTGVNDERATTSNSFYYGDTWSLTTGKHTLRAGGEITRYQLNRTNKFAIRGSLGFDSLGSTSTLAPFSNFLQGKITSLQSGIGDPQRYFRDTDYAVFFQDDYRVARRLTLNLGLRWDLLGFAHDKYFRSGIYDTSLMPANPFLFAQSLDLGGFKGTPGVSDCTLKSCYDKDNFGPRFGFAWDVTGNQKWVVRGGYGIYFQRVSNQNLLQGSLAAPFFVQPLESRGASAPTQQLQNPLPGGPPSGVIATAFIPDVARFAGLTGGTDVNNASVRPVFVNSAGTPCLNYAPVGTPVSAQATNCVINLANFASATPDTHPPYTEQWNLSIQRDLGHGWGVEVAYVGAQNIGGLGIYAPFLARLASPSSPITVKDINGNSYAITTNTANNEPLRMQILGLDRVRGARLLANIGRSIYHSGQATVSHRFQGGLYFQAAYTWSKVIDNVSGSQSTDELNSTRNGQSGANIINDQSNPSQNRALGDFDRPHRFIVSYSWDIPIRKSGIWGSQAFQGWTISGIVTYQNGLPFSLSDSTSGGAFGNVRVGTGLLVCRAVQNTTLPTCTPGTPTTVQQAMTFSGPLQNNLLHFLNPNFVSPAAAVPNASGSTITGFGNVPRNAFRGPFQQNWDFSVAKSFHITERHRIAFRTDFFNLFNHPVFNFPSLVNVASASTFGKISTTVLPARLIQFGFRYSF